MAISAPQTPLEALIEQATYAVADFRALAFEAGEADPRTSPALRAAERLLAAVAAARATIRPPEHAPRP